MTLIHEVLLNAVQAHPPPAVTLTDRLPPAAGTVPLSGDRAYEQPCPCVTAQGWPAIVSVADRVGPDVGATVNATVPGPALLACAPPI